MAGSGTSVSWPWLGACCATLHFCCLQRICSYAPEENDMVLDPHLAKHLAHWGINMMQVGSQGHAGLASMLWPDIGPPTV